MRRANKPPNRSRYRRKPTRRFFDADPGDPDDEIEEPINGPGEEESK